MIWGRSAICAPSRWIPSRDPPPPGRKFMRLQKAVSLISTPGPTSWGPMACRITNGDPMTKHGHAVDAVFLIGLFLWAGCAGPQPSARDLQVIESASKAESKQARGLAELKAGAQKSAARLKRKLSTVELAVSSTEGALDRPVSTGAPPSSSLRTVIVRPGDTLWDLARKHRVQLAELMTVNKLASDRIRPGQELILPEP